MRKLILAWLLLASTSAYAGADGQAILKQQCASCHAIEGTAATTLKDLLSRKGSDLFYAGNKYQATWLASWLQKPKRIRPAGMVYLDHIKPGVKRDMIDESTLKPHMSLNQADAEAVTKTLMTFTPHNDLIAATSYDASVSAGPMGEMLFDKIYGCMGCHQIEPDFGGLSGPEVYTAGSRLQAAYMLSYIRNPQAWNPKIWMPNKHIPDPNDLKLVNYIVKLSKENFDE
jgi:mono/diheme cytochrome c family protein